MASELPIIPLISGDEKSEIGKTSKDGVDKNTLKRSHSLKLEIDCEKPKEGNNEIKVDKNGLKRSHSLKLEIDCKKPKEGDDKIIQINDQETEKIKVSKKKTPSSFNATFSLGKRKKITVAYFEKNKKIYHHINERKNFKKKISLDEYEYNKLISLDDTIKKIIDEYKTGASNVADDYSRVFSLGMSKTFTVNFFRGKCFFHINTREGVIKSEKISLNEYEFYALINQKSEIMKEKDEMKIIASKTYDKPDQNETLENQIKTLNNSDQAIEKIVSKIQDMSNQNETPENGIKSPDNPDQN